MLQVELHLKHEVKLLKEESTQHNIIQLVVKPTRKEVEAPPPSSPLSSPSAYACCACKREETLRVAKLAKKRAKRAKGGVVT